jgi:hypothetical protein
MVFLTSSDGRSDMLDRPISGAAQITLGPGPLHDQLKHLLFAHFADSPLADIGGALNNHNAVSHFKNIGEPARNDDLSYALPLQLGHGLEHPLGGSR